MSQEVLQEPEIHMLYFKLVGINSNKRLKHPNFPYSSIIRQMGPLQKKQFLQMLSHKILPNYKTTLLQFAKEKRLTDNFLCAIWSLTASVTSTEIASFQTNAC